MLLSFLLFGQVEALPRNARNLKRILKLLRVDIVHVMDILVEKIEQPIVKLESETEDHWTNASSDYLANSFFGYLGNPVPGSDVMEIAEEDTERKAVAVKTEGISIEEFYPGMSCWFFKRSWKNFPSFF